MFLENKAIFKNIYENTMQRMGEIFVNHISEEGPEYIKNYYKSTIKRQTTHLKYG